MIIPNIWENKKCSKPPTSFLFPAAYISFFTTPTSQTTTNEAGHDPISTIPIVQTLPHASHSV